MRLRQQILRGIVSAINLTDDVQQHFSDDSPSSKNVENEMDISTLLSQMEEQHKSCSQKLEEEVLMSTPQAPYRSRLSCYLPSLQVSVAKSFLSAVYSIHIYSVSQTEDESTVDILNVLLEQFTSYQELLGKEVLLTETYLGERWRVLELQQFNIESFCLAVVLSGSILSLLRSQKGVKKNKKKIVSPKFGSAVPKFNQLLDKLEEHGKTLHQTLQENYKKYISELESECLVDSFSSLSVNLPDLLGAEKQNLVLKMKESYLVQEQQMSTIIQDKIKYIQALKV
ncbi:uncharacterized protein LOC111711944 [Eurytemora carolleeae]|uniref:uncharacterized protein LOC111711944 n=1 Tax=Eurytemora carolleeae TaxID=1294199 RepID=UPI000C77596E|nr:uncharacterized protein LOC111711944 [Eurytemora carolleeae]|eukprot:XP_023342196.1 uncharacterized protein LOC111711944 [Eurytemora affinis]